MALVIEDPELGLKIQTVAHALGKSVEETIWIALERMNVRDTEDMQTRLGSEIDWPQVRRILARVDARPILDYRSDDAILGYNEHGHFG